MPELNGAMLGGYILNKSEFINAFKLLLSQEDNHIFFEKQVRNAILNIKQKNNRAAYKNIENIEVKLLQNPGTSLMVITNLSDTTGKNTKWYWTASEKNVITKRGGLSITKTIKNNIEGFEAEQIVTQHLMQFINDVETKALSKQERREIFNISNIQRDIKSRAGKEAHYKHIWNYRWIIYGNNPNWKGNVADAYIQHLGDLHTEFFNFNMNKSVNISSSVKQEEGAHFLQLLVNSTNATGWYTGGDLILLNSDHEVIANIQLKTRLSGSKAAIKDAISTSRLKMLLEELQTMLVNNDIDALAESFYEGFKTSGVLPSVDEQIEKSAYELAIQKLGLNNLTT